MIAKYGTSKEELVAFFGKVRDDLINENLDAWVSLNKVKTSSFVNLSTKTEVICFLDVRLIVAYLLEFYDLPITH